MYSPNIHAETDEMKRLKQDLERAKVELNKLQKRLLFLETEHNNRVNQMSMRSQGELKDLQRRHLAQMKHLDGSGSRGTNLDANMLQGLKTELAKLEAEKQKISNAAKRNIKNDGPAKDTSSKTQDTIMRSPEMLRVNDHIQKVTMQMSKLEQNLTRHQQSELATKSRLKRFQQTELDKLTNEQQNKVKGLHDAWFHESQSLTSQMQMYENIRSRTETRYKDLSRQHTIDTKRQADVASRKRAQTGDNTGRKNFAKAEGENMLDPNNAQSGARRSGASRW